MIDITATIDHAIKEVWLNDIASDYEDFALLKEDSLKCALYHHLRVQLEDILSEHNLRIYPEYYIPELKYKSDIAIVKIDPYDIKPKLKDMALNIEAIIEIKYDYAMVESTIDAIKSDVSKLSDYLKRGVTKRCYMACIFENERESLRWLDQEDADTWAKGKVTELSAGIVDEYMTFEVFSY